MIGLGERHPSAAIALDDVHSLYRRGVLKTDQRSVALLRPTVPELVVEREELLRVLQSDVIKVARPELVEVRLSCPSDAYDGSSRALQQNDISSLDLSIRRTAVQREAALDRLAPVEHCAQKGLHKHSEMNAYPPGTLLDELADAVVPDRFGRDVLDHSPEHRKSLAVFSHDPSPASRAASRRSRLNSSRM